MARVGLTREVVVIAGRRCLTTRDECGIVEVRELSDGEERSVSAGPVH